MAPSPPNFTFTLCNPPFYTSREEMAAASDIKIESGHAAPTAAENELITPGGEVMFVCKMIEESLSIRQGSL